MSAYKNEYRAYLKASGTLPKTRQIVVLYDTIIRHLRHAQEAIEQKRFQDRYNLTVKATEIITALQSSLDFENGGKIANVLHGFYTSMFRRIIGLNFLKDAAEGTQQCSAIIEEMKQMRQTWETIDNSLGTGTASPVNTPDASPPPSGGKQGPDPVVISA